MASAKEIREMFFLQMLELSTILAAYQANADSAAPLQNPSFIPSLPGPNAT